MTRRNPNKTAAGSKVAKSKLDNEGSIVIHAPPVVPKGMTAEARKIFRHIVEHMPAGSVTVVDSDIIRDYAETSVTLDEWKAKVKATPFIIGSRGQLVVNPLVREIRAHTELKLKLQRQIGLTPYARQQIRVPLDDGDEHGEFAGLISINGGKHTG